MLREGEEGVDSSAGFDFTKKNKKFSLSWLRCSGKKGADTWDAVFLQNLKLSGTSIGSLFNKAFQNWPNLNQSFFSQNFGIGSKSKALKMW